MSKPQTIIVPQDDRTRRVTVILYEAERKRAAQASETVAYALSDAAAVFKLISEGISTGHFARNDARDQRVRMCSAGQRKRIPANDHGRHIGLDRDRPAEFLHQHHGIDGPAAEAAIGFRQRRAQDAELSGECLPDAGVAPAVTAKHGLPLVEIIIVRKVAPQRVAQHPLRLGEIEVQMILPGNTVWASPRPSGRGSHQSPSTLFAMMLRWISCDPP